MKSASGKPASVRLEMAAGSDRRCRRTDAAAEVLTHPSAWRERPRLVAAGLAWHKRSISVVAHATVVLADVVYGPEDRQAVGGAAAQRYRALHQLSAGVACRGDKGHVEHRVRLRRQERLMGGRPLRLLAIIVGVPYLVASIRQYTGRMTPSGRS